LGSAFYDGCEGSLGTGTAFWCVFGVLMATGSSGSFADGLRLYMAEVQVDGKSYCYIVGLYAPEGGEGGHAVVEVLARYHIGTKVRSF
jgi:hypothetical protein